MNIKDFYSVPQAAELLGISRVAAFKRVQAGTLPAIRVGGIHLIHKDHLFYGLEDQREAKKAVDKAISDYGEALRWLAKE